MSRPSQQTTVEAVVTAVAEQKGVEPTALERPLYEVVDSECLGNFFGDTTGEISFEYLDTMVTVDSEGEVSVRPLATPTP
ncbi:HalOD1 output domain-containing protein [Halobaculum marinum]|uniref:HalOD1 output domain-containing protein n=1 Tax=Halobaculum marinum TaxID=3031996 RepID=A0ABD5WYX8_9EURY|nr:HalOD1 output domain-containing protein [Halobaculum sp. DT55]